LKKSIGTNLARAGAFGNSQIDSSRLLSGNERCYPECSVDVECKEAYGEHFICHSSDICLVE
jgi:hypothetical protein